MRHTLRCARGHLRVERGRLLALATLARNFCVFVFVFSVAGCAARLLDVLSDHGDDGVIGHAPLTRTVVVQNVTKPKLALLHQCSRDTDGGERKSERRTDLSTTARASASGPPDEPRPRREPSIVACAWRPPTPPASRGPSHRP